MCSLLHKVSHDINAFNQLRTMVMGQLLGSRVACNRELKQPTFLTTRTARVTSKDWAKNCDWLITSNLLPVDVRVVKNVACLSSLICTGF